MRGGKKAKSLPSLKKTPTGGECGKVRDSPALSEDRIGKAHRPIVASRFWGRMGNPAGSGWGSNPGFVGGESRLSPCHLSLLEDAAVFLAEMLGTFSFEDEMRT